MVQFPVRCLLTRNISVLPQQACGDQPGNRTILQRINHNQCENHSFNVHDILMLSCFISLNFHLPSGVDQQDLIWETAGS